MAEVECELEAMVSQDADLVLAVAPHAAHDITERLDVSVDGRPLEVVELQDAYGTRRHCFRAPVGLLKVTYGATVSGPAPAPASADDELVFLRPSRYCDSDRLVNAAHTLFSESTPAAELIEQIRQWTLRSIQYAPGTTDHLDGASEIYLSRRGVCRDTAHVLTAFARALGIPARVAAVYAPGLVPMDFHAVSEVLIDDEWWVVDGTGLAPRGSMIRVAAGRDAADTAFLDSIRGQIELTSMRVDARVDGALPHDNGSMPVRLG